MKTFDKNQLNNMIDALDEWYYKNVKGVKFDSITWTNIQNTYKKNPVLGLSMIVMNHYGSLIYISPGKSKMVISHYKELYYILTPKGGQNNLPKRFANAKKFNFGAV